MLRMKKAPTLNSEHMYTVMFFIMYEKAPTHTKRWLYVCSNVFHLRSWIHFLINKYKNFELQTHGKIVTGHLCCLCLFLFGLPAIFKVGSLRGWGCAGQGPAPGSTFDSQNGLGWGLTKILRDCFPSSVYSQEQVLDDIIFVWSYFIPFYLFISFILPLPPLCELLHKEVGRLQRRNVSHDNFLAGQRFNLLSSKTTLLGLYFFWLLCCQSSC